MIAGLLVAGKIQLLRSRLLRAKQLSRVAACINFQDFRILNEFPHRGGGAGENWLAVWSKESAAPYNTSPWSEDVSLEVSQYLFP